MSDKLQQTSIGVALSRVFWMMVGPALLALLAAKIATEGGGWLTAFDVAYLALLGGLVVVRLIEFRTGRAQTSEGEPLTAVGLRKYAAGAAALGLALWAGANAIGNG